MGSIASLSKTKEIINKYDLFIKKSYGQNFLIDSNVLNNIVSNAGVNKDINVIEIGPGIGSLTEVLLENANKVMSYEIDDKLIPVLQNELKRFDNFTLIHQDFLKADVIKDINTYFNDQKDIYIISNLPYYITTPIIMHILEHLPKIKRCAFMMQKEVADRITANRGGKDYNNLSIAIKYYANAKKILNVSRHVFIPEPNVDSAVVLLDIYQEKKYQVIDESSFFSLIRNSFKNRRKTLINNLNNSYIISKDELESVLGNLNISATARAEELEIEDFVRLEKELKNALVRWFFW